MRCFLSCVLLLGMLHAATPLLSPAYAQTPTYDMTGTWDYQVTGGWTDCSGESPPQEIGTATITQSGNTFIFSNNFGDVYPGSIVGSRYQVFDAHQDGDFIDTLGIVWNLDSASVGKGYVAAIETVPPAFCSIMADIHLQKRGVCTPTDTVMCLQNGRYSVSVTWKNEQSQTGVGHAIPSTDDSGLFWFFSDSNMELLIKVLDGCGINNRYWVFFAATTDQEFTVTITDTKTGQQVQYTNPIKTPADAVTDTDAFATCP